MSDALPRSFSAPKVKIARAQRHLAELETEIAAFLDTRPARFVSRIIKEPGEQRAEFHLFTQHPPEDLGAIIGDVVHNLRSALDLTACEMVRIAEGPSADVGNVYFPFCRRADDLDAMIRRRDFHRAGDAAVALLRELKPYPSGNALLRAIHDLDIHDKHSALIPTFMTVGGPIISRWDDDGTPNLSFVGDPTAPTELALVFPASVPFAGTDILKTLKSFMELTASVVESFRTLADSVQQ